VLASIALGLGACGDDEGGRATVQIHNDFDNPQMDFQPPWTICESWYLGVQFGAVPIGETSAASDVTPGLGHVLMVAAWDDPDCSAEHCLPLASKHEEEAVDRQRRTIALNLPNHQGPCPPEGVEPIPEERYEQIRTLWPEYEFAAYADRADNPQCQH
jgi:hypothetical protein